MKRACIRFHGAPNIKPNALRSFLKRDLYNNLRKNVVAISVDSAADEVLSAEMMRCSLFNDDQKKLTPNLQFVLRDKAHGSRRITSRPYGADGFVKDVMTMFCRSRCSHARIIQSSEEARRVFAGFVHGSLVSNKVRTTVKNLRAAAHRFESFQKPLGRTCLHLHSCIKTMLHVAAHGKTDSVQRAKQWLTWVDTEKCLTAAMLASLAHWMSRIPTQRHCLGRSQFFLA
jgi:hypothetical protein